MPEAGSASSTYCLAKQHHAHSAEIALTCTPAHTRTLMHACTVSFLTIHGAPEQVAIALHEIKCLEDAWPPADLFQVPQPHQAHIIHLAQLGCRDTRASMHMWFAVSSSHGGQTHGWQGPKLLQ